MTAHLNDTKEPHIVFAITAYNKLRAVDVVFDEDEKPVEDPLTKGPINNLLKVCVDRNIIRQAVEDAYKDFLVQVDELGEQGSGNTKIRSRSFWVPLAVIAIG